MATITDRYILEVDTQGATQGMNAAGGAVAGLGTRLKSLGPLAVAAAGALAGLGAIRGITNTINDMDDLAKSARLAGAAASDDAFRGFQVLQQAMNEAGVDAATFERGMLQLNTRLRQGQEGHTAYGEIVDKLGDSIKDSSGELLTGADAMEAMINALNAGTISTEDFAKVVGGRAGPVIQQQFASLQDGAEGLAATLSDVEANSNIVSLEASENAEVFNDTLGRLGEVAGQLGTDIATALLPILVELAEGVMAVLPSVIDGVKAAFEALRPIIDALIPVGQALFELLQALWPVFETLLGVIGPVVGILADGLVGAINAVVAVITTVVESITGFIEKIREIAGAVGEVAGSVGEKWSGMTEGMANGAKAAADKVTGFFGGMYDTVVGNSIIPDMAEGVLGSFDDMTGGMVTKIGSVVGDITSSFAGVAQTISNQFESLTGVSLGAIRNQVESLSQSVGSRINSLASSVRSRFNSVIAGAGDIADNLGLTDLIDNIGNFAGGFANGGTIPTNSFGLVGERGPELISGPANITPLSELGSQSVTYNINAVDASSFRDLVARDPAFIHAVASQGANRLPQRRKL